MVKRIVKPPPTKKKTTLPTSSKNSKTRPKTPNSISPTPPLKSSLKIKAPTSHTSKSKSPQTITKLAPTKKKSILTRFNPNTKKNPTVIEDTNELVIKEINGPALKPAKIIRDATSKGSSLSKSGTKEKEGNKSKESIKGGGPKDLVIDEDNVVKEDFLPTRPFTRPNNKLKNFKRLMPLTLTDKEISKEVSLLKPKNDIYNVEEILDKRKSGRYYEYLIKWEGYPDEQNSWEPKKHLPAQMVQEFEEKSKNLQARKDVENNEETHEIQTIEDEKKTIEIEVVQEFETLPEKTNMNNIMDIEEVDKKPEENLEKIINETMDINIDPIENNLHDPEIIETAPEEEAIKELEPVLTTMKKPEKKPSKVQKKAKRQAIAINPLQIEEEKTNGNAFNHSNSSIISNKIAQKNPLVIASDQEGPGSNRATKYGDFRLGDRFKEIKKLRFNKRLKMVYAVVEWKAREDGFVPLTSKINLEHLKTNIPNETINFLVNTLIALQDKRKEIKGAFNEEDIEKNGD